MVALVRQILKLEDGTELSPNNNSRILAMDWQVSENMNFKDPILKSENDTKNLSSIIFKDILDPNTKWYARARALVKDSGWTVWGNLDVMNYEQASDAFNTNIVPTRVSTPILTTSSDTDAHAATMFTIFAEGFSVIGNATHSATSWFIEDINGKIVWSDLENPVNKTQVSFNSMILKNNTIYRIRAMFHSSGNGTSTIASLTIKVGGSEVMELLTYLDEVDYGKTTEVVAIYPDIDANVESATWEIISMANNYAEIIYTVTTIGVGYGTMNIPANLLKQDTNYVLKFKANIPDVETHWKYIQFKTINSESIVTALVVTPTNIVVNIGETYTSLVIAADENAVLTYSIDNTELFEYDLDKNIITGLVKGGGYLTITAQAPGKEANTVKIFVVVNREKVYTYKPFDMAVFLDVDHALGAVDIEPTTQTYTIPVTGKEVTLDSITLAPNEWITFTGFTGTMGQVAQIETIGGNFTVSTFIDGFKAVCTGEGECIFVVTFSQDEHTHEFRYIKLIGADIHKNFNDATDMDYTSRLTIKTNWIYDLTKIASSLNDAGVTNNTKVLAFDGLYGTYFKTYTDKMYIRGMSTASGNSVEGLIILDYTGVTRTVGGKNYRVIPIDIIRASEDYPDSAGDAELIIRLDSKPINEGDEIELDEGTTKTLEIITDAPLTYSITDNSDIATFDLDGKTIVGVSGGVCNATISAKETGKKEINFNFKIKVNGKVLDPTDLTAEINGVNLKGYDKLKIGDIANVTLTTTGNIISAESSNTDIFTFDTVNKTLTAIKDGTAELTIVVKEDGKAATTYKYTITVKELQPVEYSISPNGAISLDEGNSTTLIVKTTGVITHAIVDGSIISYDPDTYKITALKEGTTKLVLTFTETGKATQIETITITVNENLVIKMTLDNGTELLDGETYEFSNGDVINIVVN